jgi:hypothetical protein
VADISVAADKNLTEFAKVVTKATPVTRIDLPLTAETTALDPNEEAFTKAFKMFVCTVGVEVTLVDILFLK